MTPTPHLKAELTAKQIKAGWEQTFSTNNPFCPCDLRSFTKAVNWAEREFQLLQVENAGLQASVGHLGVMVDELRGLTQRAIKAMSTLHSAATPDDSTEDIDARIPGHDFATFVNEHAALLHAFAHHADMPAAPAPQQGAQA